MFRQKAYYDKRTRLILAALIFLAATVIGLLLPASVNALSNKGPDPTDIGTPAGGVGEYVISSLDYSYASIPRTVVPIYFTNNTGAKKIFIYGGDLCNGALESAPAGNNYRDETDRTANPVGTPAAQFFVSKTGGGGVSATVTSRVSDSPTCYQDRYELVFDGLTLLTIDPNTGLYRAFFNAESLGTIVRSQNRYHIEIEDPTAKVGFSATTGTSSFGVSHSYPNSGYRRYQLPFGPDCSVTGPTQNSALIYDLDNGDDDIQNNTWLKTYVEQTAPNGTVSRIPLAFTRTSDPASASVAFDDLGGNTYIIRSSTSGESVYVQMTVQPLHTYRLVMDEVFYKNILQFRLPYDSIFHDVNNCYDPIAFICMASSLTPRNSPEVNQPLTVTGKLRYTGGPPNPSVKNGTITVTGPGGFVSSNTITDPMKVGTEISIPSKLFSPPRTGMYTATWSVEVNGTRNSPPCTDTFYVTAMPYLSVQGGDVVAGSSFHTPTLPCSAAGTEHNTKAGVVSWNRNVSPTFRGAGGQYGVFSYNFIQEFVTNKGNNSGPSSLSFSNVNDNTTGAASMDEPDGLYGGFWGGAPCVDYWKNKPATGLSISNGSLSGLSNGVYVHSGNLTIEPSNIKPGARITVYVEGNVYINGGGGIVYDKRDTAWSSIWEIPLFKLIVNGTIYIDKDVPQLDGIYVAVPNENYVNLSNSYSNPARGTIATCSTRVSGVPRVYSPTLTTASNMITACDKQLVVNGSMSANQIFFLRTHGSMSSTPAEVINYGPEVWLAPSGDNPIGDSYRSVIGLPPVL